MAIPTPKPAINAVLFSMHAEVVLYMIISGFGNSLELEHFDIAYLSCASAIDTQLGAPKYMQTNNSVPSRVRFEKEGPQSKPQNSCDAIQ